MKLGAVEAVLTTGIVVVRTASFEIVFLMSELFFTKADNTSTKAQYEPLLTDFALYLRIISFVVDERIIFQSRLLLIRVSLRTVYRQIYRHVSSCTPLAMVSSSIALLFKLFPLIDFSTYKPFSVFPLSKKMSLCTFFP